MSLLSIEDLLFTFCSPGESVRECHGDEAEGHFSELLRFQEARGLQVRKKYFGKFAGLLTPEKKHLQRINASFRQNTGAARYLPHLIVPGKGSAAISGDTGQDPDSSILMQWHGFDIQDLMRLAPIDLGNTNWQHPTFLLQLLKHALGALRALHALGIVHCAIAWENIVLEPELLEADPASARHEFIVDPSKLTLVDFGVSCGGVSTYEHLYGLDFKNNHPFKSARLRDAHEQLSVDQNDTLLKEIGYTADLFALGALLGDHVVRYCNGQPLAGQRLGAQRRCLVDVCRDLCLIDEQGFIEGSFGHRFNVDEADREALYSYWLNRIEMSLGTAPTRWNFIVPEEEVLFGWDELERHYGDISHLEETAIEALTAYEQAAKDSPVGEDAPEVLVDRMEAVPQTPDEVAQRETPTPAEAQASFSEASPVSRRPSGRGGFSLLWKVATILLLAGGGVGVAGFNGLFTGSQEGAEGVRAVAKNEGGDGAPAESGQHIVLPPQSESPENLARLGNPISLSQRAPTQVTAAGGRSAAARESAGRSSSERANPGQSAKAQDATAVSATDASTARADACFKLQNAENCYKLWQQYSQNGVDAKGVKALEHAARLQHHEALYDLGRLQEKGEGVPQNTKQAIDNYRIAAGLGDMSAKGALYRLNERLNEQEQQEKSGGETPPEVPPAVNQSTDVPPAVNQSAD